MMIVVPSVLSDHYMSCPTPECSKFIVKMLICSGRENTMHKGLPFHHSLIFALHPHLAAGSQPYGHAVISDGTWVFKVCIWHVLWCCNICHSFARKNQIQAHRAISHPKLASCTFMFGLPPLGNYVHFLCSLMFLWWNNHFHHCCLGNSHSNSAGIFSSFAISDPLLPVDVHSVQITFGWQIIAWLFAQPIATLEETVLLHTW
jgi:hypothetical protein